MISLTTPSHLKFDFLNSLHRHKSLLVQSNIVETAPSIIFKTSRSRRRRTQDPDACFSSIVSLSPKLCPLSRVLTRVSSSDEGGGTFEANPQQISNDLSVSEASNSSSPTSGDGYVALFIRMLGLDNDPLERELAVDALWKYSLGGKQCIDAIMKYRGSVLLTVNLLNSESSTACEAAAGLLRMMSSVDIYRDLVAESGAIQETASLLRRSSLTSNVKEQSLFMLLNLSVDEKLGFQIANSDLLPLLIKFLEDGNIEVKEAAAGVLGNLALSLANHTIMVEAGVIPELAKFLTNDNEGSKVLRNEAKNALLELAKDDYYKILVMEEGLVVVPLIGEEAYKSFRPALDSLPSLPDGTEMDVEIPSRDGASRSLLESDIRDDKIAKIVEANKNAMFAWRKQRYLARVGSIESEDDNRDKSNSGLDTADQRFTILPWMDGVARLVLILELEDELAIARAAESIADASFSEYMRVSFMEAGAVRNLVQLMDHHSESVRSAVVRALEKLSISNDVCQRIEAEGVLNPLIRTLEESDIYGNSAYMILNILARILDPSKEMKSKFHDEPVNGSEKGGNEAGTSSSKMTSRVDSIQERDLSDSAFLSCLIQILKTSSRVLQMKAASILEYLTNFESCKDKIISLDLESALDSVFQQNFSNGEEDMESEIAFHQPELYSLEVQEAGLAISAASRLLTRLLDSQHFRELVNASRLMESLRKILASDIPLHNKDWAAACLVKLGSLSGPTKLGSENPINTEVILYETIPRLIEQIQDSLSPKTQEVAVLELNRIISEGVVDSTRAVAAEGGIFPLVKLIEEGNDRVLEAGLAILYNLSMDSENHPAIVAAGAVPVLRRIVLSERPQWIRALHLLRTLPT